ncbi:hypothetical protein AB9F43_33225, partial [Rhizobium leguminosarum]
QLVRLQRFGSAHRHAVDDGEELAIGNRLAGLELDLVVLKVSGAGVRPLFGAAEGLNGEAIRRDLEAPEVGEFAAFLLG